MAHKILVMSPLHNLGTSVVSTFLAQGLTFHNKTCMLLFNEPESLLPNYLGIDTTEDPTRSVMQIVRLIDNGSIADKDILDYCYTISKNAHLLNLADRSLSEKDRTQVVQHVYTRVPTNIAICDNSADIDDKSSKMLIDESDMIFIVIEPSIKAAQRLKLWLQHPNLVNHRNVYVIINKYNEVVSSMRDYAKYLGMPANRVCKIHYNPWVPKCCFNGGLSTILPLSRELDARVANLKNDIDELGQCVEGDIIMQTRKGF